MTQYGSIPWIIIDPSPSPANNVSAKFIKGFFDETIQSVPIDSTVVHSHVLEHLYEPNKFMEHLSSIMSLGQKHIFSFPNMNAMLEQFHGNMLNFEHTICIQEEHVEYLLKKNGFKIIDKKYFKKDHSIFYATERIFEKKLTAFSDDFIKSNRYKIKNYFDKYKNFVSNVNIYTNKNKNDLNIYLFGAHINSQLLIYLGLGMQYIESIIDNDTNKQGKKLYGTNLFVDSPTILKDVKNPTVILTCGAYNGEIKQDILENINPDTTFLEI